VVVIVKYVQTTSMSSSSSAGDAILDVRSDFHALFLCEILPFNGGTEVGNDFPIR